MSCQRIKFHLASCSNNKKSEVVTQHQTKSDLNGDEVKEFYERVISNKSNKSKEDVKVAAGNQILKKYCTKNSNKRHTKMNESKRNNQLLKLAQEGDLKGLKKLLSNEHIVNIDVMDAFKWTPLMCAACSGHTDVVKFLLQCGANKELTNSNGKTAYDLAKTNNCKNVMRLFENWDIRSKTDSTKSCISGKMTSGNYSAVSEKGLRKFFCVVCARTFKDTTPSQHRTSTVHLFNKKPKQGSTWYHLNENNKGFQMLLKDGWNKEKGLGPEGKEGLKFPVKTVLKRDRKCLGSSKSNDSVPRVTHFTAFDQRAVKRAKVTHEDDEKKEHKFKSKKNLRKQKQKEKEWEMDFRRSFYLE